jgi:phosphatidylserine/phosphatidylglycerophosphate/cardiolipin synthase-like enzyme
MAWENDGHGLAFKPKEVKIYAHTHSWGMKLSQLHRQTGTVRIITYSLPDIAYIQAQFNRRPYDIFLLCHSKFLARAREVQYVYPRIAVAVHDRIHAKALLISPETCYFGSANFGESHWHEVEVGVRSREAHDMYVQVFETLWGQATVLGPLGGGLGGLDEHCEPRTMK